MFIKTASAATALFFAASALWADPSATLIYDQFEAAVPHLDLESCPTSMAQDDVFCRATLRHDEIHVFVFSTEGDNPFVGFKSFPADGISALLE